MIAAAANAIPQASCVVNNEVFFGSKNLLVSWDTESASLAVRADLDSNVTAVCLYDEQRILLGTENGHVHLLDSGELVEVVNLTKAITCIAADPAARTWSCGSMDGKIYVYSYGSSEPVEQLSFRGYALCLALCGPLVIIGGTTNQIVVHHLVTKETIYLSGHESWVRSLSLKQGDNNNVYTLASASQEKYIRLWSFAVSENNRNELFSMNQKVGEWSIAFEALLMGHDDWVVSVAWDPHGSGKLLSASADSSLIIWQSEAEGELWTPEHRLGDLSTWGASTATGTSGGFWTGLWLQDIVVTLTRTGSWRVWSRDDWEPVVGPTGHFKEVTDVTWFKDKFLLSTSLDQTTRLWAVNNLDDAPYKLKEIGRPQIHGYDMITVASLTNHSFVSAGDEKVMRVFMLPRQVAEQLSELSSSSIGEAPNFENLPVVAGVPALGLSNKPEDENAVISLPPYPREDHLQRLTLWPETEKLYGHGFEINTVAVSNQLNTIISCCRANTEQHAKLRFYSTETWQEVQPALGGHTLTVTNLKVSPDETRVLSVSRDRKLMVVDIAKHEIVLDLPKAHTRIIWDGCWINCDVFVTVSRDKFIKKWNIGGELLGSAKLEDPITAVDYQNGLLVAGDERGQLTYLDADLQVRGNAKLAGRVNRIALKLPYIAAATDLLISVIEAPKA